MTGFKNVENGVKDFFTHFFGSDSLLTKVFHPVVDEILAYEKTHGKEDLQKALDAGETEYRAFRTAGKKVGESLIAGVSAFFESEAKDIKAISTQAATAALAGLVK